MIKALCTAASGLVAESVKQDIIANNLANAQSPGFKRQRVVMRSFENVLREQMTPPMSLNRPRYPVAPGSSWTTTVETAWDNTDGPLRNTGNECDLALQGPGKFVVESKGATRYTRAGSFRINDDGELVTPEGEKLQGESGPIAVNGGKFSVDADGSVTVNGVKIGKLKIVGGVDGETTVLQGYLEDANISVVREMVDMIANLRAFEANQKVAAAVDTTLDKLINEAGNVRV